MQYIHGTLESIFPDIFTHEHFRTAQPPDCLKWRHIALSCPLDSRLASAHLRCMYGALLHCLVFFIFPNTYTMHNAYFVQGLCIVAVSLFTRLGHFPLDSWPVRIYGALPYLLYHINPPKLSLNMVNSSLFLSTIKLFLA